MKLLGEHLSLFKMDLFELYKVHIISDQLFIVNPFAPDMSIITNTPLLFIKTLEPIPGINLQ